MSTVKLRNVRLSFNSIVGAEDYGGNGDFNYNAKVLLPKGSDEAQIIQDALLKTAEEAFPGKGAEVIKKIQGDNMQYCLSDFDDDHFQLATKRKAKAGRPVVVDQNRKPLTETDGKPYSGCYVTIIVRPWAMGSKGRHWVRCALEGLQFTADGQSFSKRISSADFDDLGTGANSDDGSDLL